MSEPVALNVAKDSLPTITVCIANFNGINVIDECIQSVLQQTGSIRVEIIVHDDASTDGSVEYIRLNYPNVRLIESTENVGFCISNNRMVAVARGEYVLLLNNDAALLPDALATLNQTRIDLARPAILSLPQYDYETGKLLDIGSLLDPFLNPVPNLDPTRRDVGMVMGACLWIDKTLWDELGGFPEWFGSIGEDLYLCCRARLADYPVHAPSISGYRHRVGQSFGGGKVADGRLRSTFRRRALSERNKTFVMAMTYPAPFFQLMLPLHLLLQLLEGMFLSILKLDSRYLRAIYLPAFSALVRHRKEWGMVRQAVQHRRRLARADFYAVFDWVPYKLRMMVRYGLPDVKD
jgi:GT2 family glycosyltransferase